MTWFESRPHFVPCLIAAVMALIAIADLPYGYYTLMRLVVCATAIFVVVVGAKDGQMWAIWLYGILALLFNPVLPVHLTKGLWQPLDFITGVALVVAALVVHGKPQPVSA